MPLSPVFRGSLAEDQVFTVRELAEHLGVSRGSVHGAIRRGELECSRDEPFGYFVITAAQVRAFLALRNGVVVAE